MNYENIWNSFTKQILILTGFIIVFIASLAYISQLAVQGRFADSDYTGRIVVSAVLVIATIAVVQLVDRLLSRLQDRQSVSAHQKEIGYRMTQIAASSSVFLLVVVYVWDVELSNILIGAGALGVIIGFATRKVLSSVVSGIIIMSTNMFRVGEWIKYEEKFGRIEKITFFYTQTRSPQGEEHIIPNDKITSKELTNISHGQYRNDMLISIDYAEDITHVTEVCDDVLDSLQDDDSSYISGYSPTSVKSFDDSAIILSIKPWIDAPAPSMINESQTRLLANIKERFDDEEIRIPYPQRTINDRE